MLKLWIGALLALTAVNSIAGNMYIYKDKGGQVLLTKVNPSGNFDKFTKKVKVTYYSDRDSSLKKVNRGEAERAKYLAIADEDVSLNIDKLNRGIYLKMADE